MSWSRSSRASSRTNAIVVETARPSLPAKNSAKASHSGGFSLHRGARRPGTTRRAPRAAPAGTASPGCPPAGGRTAACAACSSVIGNVEARAELTQLLLVELLLLVRDVAALARLAQAVALDRLGQDDRGRAACARRPPCTPRRPCRVVAAAAQLAQSARRSGRPPSPAAAGRRRRSARGCTRRT